MSFIYDYLHFQHSFCNQPVCKQNIKQQPHRACERNQNKCKTKSGHVQICHAFYCSIQPTSNAMVSLMEGFTVRRQSEKEDFLSIIYCLAQYDVLSCIVCIGGINPFSKTLPFSFLSIYPLKSANCPSSPLFRKSSLYTGFS